jgi:ABC-2 type transport system permease protein
MISSAKDNRKLHSIRKFFSDLKYLWFEYLYEFRAYWYWHIIFSLLLPAAMIFAIGHIGSGLMDENSQIYIITGTVILAVTTEGLGGMASRIGSMRRDGIILYYSSLPISKSAFLFSVVLSRLMNVIPGVIIPLILGPTLFHVHIQITLWLVLLLPLIMISQSIFGLALGVAITNTDIMLTIVSALQGIVVLIAPIFIPIASLPLPLQILGYCFPPTYAADVLRHALTGSIDTAFYTDILILFVFSVVGLVVVNRRLRWRIR